MTKNYIYQDEKFIEKDKAKIHVDTHALHYGTGYFGGIRAYWNPKKESLFIFRLKDHTKRLWDSAKILGLKEPKDLSNLEQIIITLLRKNNYRQGVYVRPLIFVSEPTYIAFDLRKLETSLLVTTIPLGHYLEVSGGIKVMISSWRRQPSSAIPPRAKPTGIYLNTTLANTEAKTKGFDEAIFLTQNGYVSEGSAENIFLVKGNTLITPSVDSDILIGITRKTVIELAQKVFGIKTIEKKVKPRELFQADEIFLTGTGAEVTPVVQVDNKEIGNGNPGDLTIKIRDLYFEIVHGQRSEYSKWLTKV